MQRHDVDDVASTLMSGCIDVMYLLGIVNKHVMATKLQKLHELYKQECSVRTMVILIVTIFGTIENCSRHGWFEPLRVSYGAKSGSKWR